MRSLVRRPLLTAALCGLCLLTTFRQPGTASAHPAAPLVVQGAEGGAATPWLASRAVQPARVDGAVDGDLRDGWADYLVRLSARPPAMDPEALLGFDAPGVQRELPMTSLDGAVAFEAVSRGAERRFSALDAVVPALESGGHLREVERFPIAGVLAVVGDRQSVAALSRLPGVAEIVPNRVRRLPHLSESTAIASGKPGWNVRATGADRAWRELGTAGQGVVVATIDSGVDWGHPALRQAYRGWRGDHDYNWMDFARPGRPSLRPRDDNGHGTNVMGVIVGRYADRVYGVAPRAEWISARAFDAQGFSTDRRLLRAAEWIIAPTALDGSLPRPDLAPDIVNCSWALDDGADPLFEGIVAAWRAVGIVPIFAAGNDDDGTGVVGSVMAPASYPASVAVGAVDAGSAIWYRSKGGPSFFGGLKPDLVAPGVGVPVTARSGGSSYGLGTSIAAPHVAGAAALMLSANPELGVGDVIRGLQGSALDLGTPGPDEVYGYGELDAFEAARWALGVGRIAGRVLDEHGRPLPAASVTIAPGVDARPAQVELQTGADGSYAAAVPAGSWLVRASAAEYRTAEVRSDVAALRTSLVDLHVARKPLTAVSGRASDVFGDALAGVTVVDEETGLSATTGPDGEYAIELPHGQRALRFSKRGRRSVKLSIEVADRSLGGIDVTLASAPRLLLVDADGDQGGRIHPYVLRALEARGYIVDLWVTSDTVGVPGLSDLTPYDLVVWLHLYGSPGTTDARSGGRAATAALQAYVEGGGRLLMSGQDIGRRDSDDPPLGGAAAPDFYRHVLRARWLADTSQSRGLHGLEWLEGLTVGLEGPGGHLKGGRFAPDVVAPLNVEGVVDRTGGADGARVILAYGDGSAAALAVDGPKGRVVYVACGLEGMTDQTQAAEVLDRIVAWLETPSVALHVDRSRLGPDEESGVTVDIAGARSDQKTELEVQLGPGLRLVSTSGDLARVSDSRAAWSGLVSRGERSSRSLTVRLDGPAPGTVPLVVTATLRSLGATHTVTTALTPLTPDLERSRALVTPGRLDSAGDVRFDLVVVNDGPAPALDASAEVTMPRRTRAVTESLALDLGRAEWRDGGRRLLWRGDVAAGGEVHLSFDAVVAGGHPVERRFEVVLAHPAAGRLARQASLVVGGPDLSASSVSSLPPALLAGDSTPIDVRIVNSGAVTATATTTLHVPPGLSVAAKGATQSADGAPSAREAQVVDVVPPWGEVLRSFTLAAAPDALAGPRDVEILVSDGLEPAREVGLRSRTTIRRADLGASRAVLLPDRVTSGDIVTATLLIGNHGDALTAVNVVDSLPPTFTPQSGSVRASSGNVEVEPGTVRWSLTAHPAGEDYAYQVSPGGPSAGGAPVQGQLDADRGAWGPVPLGLAFPFYTEVFTRAWLTGDGLIAFGEPSPDAGHTLGPGGPGVPAVAALWRGGGSEEQREAGGTGVASHPTVRHDPDRVVFAWPRREGRGAVEVSLYQSGAVQMAFDSDVDPAGSVTGLRAPDGHVVAVPPAEVPPGWALSFDPPGGWEWLTFRGIVGRAVGANERVVHTARVEVPGYTRTLEAGLVVNPLSLARTLLDVEPATPVPGGILRCSLTLVPEGDLETRDVVVRIDPPLAGLIVTGSLAGGLELDPTGSLVWKGRLGERERRMLSWQMQLPDDIEVGARIVTRAWISARGVPAVGLVRALRVQATDFSGSGKWADVSVARPGQLVRFTLRAANSGAETSRVTLTDALPPGLAFVDDSARSSFGGEPAWQAEARALTWSGLLPPHSSVDVQFAARFRGGERATNAMWLTDDAGTRFAAWASVAPAAHSIFVSSCSR